MAFHVLACVANQAVPGTDGAHRAFSQDQLASWRTLLRDGNLGGVLFKFMSFVPSNGGPDNSELSVSQPVLHPENSKFGGFRRKEAIRTRMVQHLSWRF